MPARRVTSSQEISAGFASGVVETLASHPIEQVKTQFQVNRDSNGSVWKALRKQAAEGGVSRLYRGVLAACLRPQALCMYTGNEWATRQVGSLPYFKLSSETGALPVSGACVAGFITGFPEAVGVTPFEVVKVRMQSLDHVGRYPSSFACARSIVLEEGITSLYRGFWASCARNCMFNAVYFGSIRAVRSRFDLPQNLFADLGVGIVASLVATIFKMPLDIAKSRLQNQITKPALDVVQSSTVPTYQRVLSTRYTGMVHCLTAVAREEGLSALYKGFVPTSLRMCVGMPVSLVAFEAAIRQASNLNESFEV
jgi:solute carrier family 25 2-oxodicarboxylate transporter 21